MPENDRLLLDCIPDAHFSPSIIPPLLTKLQQAQYDLLFVECGIPPDVTSELNPETDAVAILQRQIAQRSGTLDMYERLLKAVGKEPTCIDRPGDWMVSVLFPSVIQKALPRDTLVRPYVPTDA